ncbi:MAG: hypothetical protein COY66_05775 [Candidatus Kerfeldbacteria bacterium CG_4_10_14_0_8_um_filter_42_10]|uniref:Uncharacterized protein n=1 Tax=Candidatus Kerfeldbacteria bacterium CG_4_10_14_0_8_um_filter_42_10 TaxID=2014248 RepID=A0A2M7RGJ2_9BACT|nr:MAG: hypothetical protein COY66_05775 [Candidatus Kerfeldbacteria bacterium CG_4_10_14_0_8_um_filter_42_10]
MELKFSFEERAKQNFPYWEKNGYALTEAKVQIQSRICKSCGEDMRIIPFRRYGVKFSGYFELECKKCKYGDTDITVLPEEKEPEMCWVVMMQGIPCRITDAERLEYLRLSGMGKKGTQIRDYTFDRLYPIIPLNEYERHLDSRTR